VLVNKVATSRDFIRSRNVISEHASLVIISTSAGCLSLVCIFEMFHTPLGVEYRDWQERGIHSILVNNRPGLFNTKITHKKREKHHATDLACGLFVFCLHNSFLSVSVQFSIRLTKNDCLTFDK
jgi:hypothetical protein